MIQLTIQLVGGWRLKVIGTNGASCGAGNNKQGLHHPAMQLALLEALLKLRDEQRMESLSDATPVLLRQ